MGILGLIDTVKDARSTLADWGKYKRQTGRWPLLSIAAHVLNFVALAAILIWLIFYSARYGWSKLRLAGTAALILVPYMLFWSWVENKAKLNDIRNRKHFSRRKVI
jgi:hypothetical protein